MLETKFVSRKLLIGIILLLFVMLSVFLITDGYFELDRDIKINSADAVDIIDQRLSSLLSDVNIFPQLVGHDLIFLSRLSSLKKVISSGEISKDLENDFLEFIKQSTAYYQLGYLDNEGNEILKLEYDGRNYQIIPREELGNKRNENYFIETSKFNEGEVFVSQLNLNSIEGDVEDLDYFPVILSSVPLFSESGKRAGVVFLSFNADYFLNDIRNFQREGEEVFLINEKGNYLAHPIRKKEFAFASGREDSIYNDYPEISEEILFDFDKRRFESGNLIFSFRYLYPTAGDFEVHKGSERIFGENPEERYFWILVSVSDKNEIDSTIRELKSKYLYFLLFSGLIIFIIVILVFIAIFKGFDNKDFKRKK